MRGLTRPGAARGGIVATRLRHARGLRGRWSHTGRSVIAGRWVGRCRRAGGRCAGGSVLSGLGVPLRGWRHFRRRSPEAAEGLLVGVGGLGVQHGVPFGIGAGLPEGLAQAAFGGFEQTSWVFGSGPAPTCPCCPTGRIFRRLVPLRSIFHVRRRNGRFAAILGGFRWSAGPGRAGPPAPSPARRGCQYCY